MARDDGQEYPGLTCWFWGELVPVGGAHGQETVAQVQVEALLCCYTADHLRVSEDTRLKWAWRTQQPNKKTCNCSALF